MGLGIIGQPPFGWSYSRHRAFTGCKRLYYHLYYGSYGGWSDCAPPQARIAFTLKRLTTYDLVLGTAVHAAARQMAAAIAARRRRPDLDELRNVVRRELNRLHLHSQDVGAFLLAPDRREMHRAVYYDLGISGEEVERIRTKLEACIANLAASPVWEELEAPGVEVLAMDARSTFPFEGVAVYAAPDLAFRVEDEFTIVDWKTGRNRPEAREQAAFYALYLREGLGAPLPGGVCTARVITLTDGEETRYVLDAADLDEAVVTLRESVAAMRAQLAQPERNLPLPMAAFPRTEKRSVCPECNFFELCRPEIYREMRMRTQPTGAEGNAG